MIQKYGEICASDPEVVDPNDNDAPYERNLKAYRYYAVNRPPVYACRPDGFTTFEVWTPPHPLIGMEGRWLHGWVDYPKPLSFEDIWKWELLPGDVDEFNRYYDWRDQVGK